MHNNYNNPVPQSVCTIIITIQSHNLLSPHKPLPVSTIAPLKWTMKEQVQGDDVNGDI